MFFFKRKKEEPKQIIHTHNWGEIGADGRQYCLICNEAHYVELKCHHRFSIIEKKKVLTTTKNGTQEQIIYVSQCIHCGKLDSHTV